jgi:hypothetical protein
MFTPTRIPGNKFKVNSGEKIFLIIVSFILFWIINSTSCTFQNEEDLLHDIKCDTINVSYNDLRYIFTGICSTCHNKEFTFRDGIIMDSYKSVVSSINTGLVQPALNHDAGLTPMPNGMAKLSDCDLNKIKAWIKAGLPENK